MDINCPNCTTHFAVPDDAIGAKGRKLKCSQCGHVWRQMPEDARAVDSDPAPTAPHNADAGVPMEMEPPPESRAADSDAAPAASREAAAGDILDDDPLAGLDFGDGDGDDDFDAFSDLVSRDDEDAPEVNLDDILSHDAEPIPEMFAQGPAGPQAKGRAGTAGKWLVGLLLVLAAVAAGGWFGRTYVVRTVPQAEAVYAGLGIPVQALGLGLEFQDVVSERLAFEGSDLLVIRGFIRNVWDTPRPVPFVQLALFDATDALVQDMVAEPPQRELAPGETVGFRIQLENPSAAARRFEVDWTAPPQTGETATGETAPAD